MFEVNESVTDQILNLLKQNTRFEISGPRHDVTSKILAEIRKNSDLISQVYFLILSLESYSKTDDIFERRRVQVYKLKRKRKSHLQSSFENFYNVKQKGKDLQNRLENFIRLDLNSENVFEMLIDSLDEPASKTRNLDQAQIDELTFLPLVIRSINEFSLDDKWVLSGLSLLLLHQGISGSNSSRLANIILKNDFDKDLITKKVLSIKDTLNLSEYSFSSEFYEKENQLLVRLAEEVIKFKTQHNELFEIVIYDF